MFALIFTDLTFQPRNWDGKAKNKGKNNTTKKPCINYSYINSNIIVDVIRTPSDIKKEKTELREKRT